MAVDPYILDRFDETCTVIDLTSAHHRRAVDIAESHLVHIYDATIIAAAEASSARVLYSEDLQSGRRFGDLEIVNPYR